MSFPHEIFAPSKKNNLTKKMLMDNSDDKLSKSLILEKKKN